MEFNTESLYKIKNMEMPFGRYKGKKLIQLPEHYLIWYLDEFENNNELYLLLQELYEIKLNGLESLIYKIQ